MISFTYTQGLPICIPIKGSIHDKTDPRIINMHGITLKQLYNIFWLSKEWSFQYSSFYRLRMDFPHPNEGASSTTTETLDFNTSTVDEKSPPVPPTIPPNPHPEPQQLQGANDYPPMVRACEAGPIYCFNVKSTIHQHFHSQNDAGNTPTDQITDTPGTMNINIDFYTAYDDSGFYGVVNGSPDGKSATQKNLNSPTSIYETAGELAINIIGGSSISVPIYFLTGQLDEASKIDGFKYTESYSISATLSLNSLWT